MPRKALPALLLLIPTLLTSCGPGLDAEPDAFSVRDSAGVRLVANGAASASALEPRVTLRIGTEGDPRYQFFRVASVAMGPEGELYVADTGHAEVRVYDAGGSWLGTLGRQGDGPGELQFPSRVWRAGDTVFVSDSRHLRLTAFAPDGRVLATSPLGSLELGVLPVAPVPGGWMLMAMLYTGWPYQVGVERRDTTRIAFAPSVAEGLGDWEARVRAGDASSDSAATGGLRPILEFAGARRYGVATPMSMTATGPLFEPVPRYAVDSLGQVHFSPADTYRIDTWDSRGRLVRRVTRAYQPVPVTPALVGRFRDAARSYWDTAAVLGESLLTKANDEARSALAHVHSLPPVGRLLASAEGALWVERLDRVADPLELEWRRPPPPPRPSLWDLFDVEGRYRATVTLPEEFTPLLVGEDWSVGVLRGEFGVQHVARLEFGRLPAVRR